MTENERCATQHHLLLVIKEYENCVVAFVVVLNLAESEAEEIGSTTRNPTKASYRFSAQFAL